jgi:GAF domain-containing protein
LPEELLAPEVAAKAKMDKKAKSRHAKKDAGINQLSDMMNAKAKKDRVAVEEGKRAVHQQRLEANGRQLAEVPGSGITLRAHLRSAPAVTTVLTNDPLLRDQLVSRIAAVYSTAAAFAVSSRCDYSDSGGFPSSQDHGSEDNSRFGSLAGGSNRSTPSSEMNSEMSGMSNFTGGRPSSTQSIPGRSSATALRCNDFIEGLANELSCRFHFYVGRPQQAMNFLLIAMRSYGRWGATAVTAALQDEFRSQLADVIAVLTGGAPIPQAAAKDPIRRPRMPVGLPRAMPPSLLPRPRVSALAQALSPPSLRSNVLSHLGNSSVGVVPFGSLALAGGHLDPAHGVVSIGGVTSQTVSVTAPSSNTMTFSADFEIEQFNALPSLVPAITQSTLDGPTLGSTASLIRNARRLQPLPAVDFEHEPTNDDSSVLGDLSPSAAGTERVQDLDIQSIIKAIQTISCELDLANLISKLMKIILTNAGAQKATLLSRQRKPRARAHRSDDGESSSERGGGSSSDSGSAALGLPSEDEMEWRIDAMIEFDQRSIFLHPEFTPTDPTSMADSPATDKTSRRISRKTSLVGVGTMGTTSSTGSRTSQQLAHTTVCPTSLLDYPCSILNFVLHSCKSVILADASTDRVFASDPCIRAHRTKSILCLPLVLRGTLISVLYLEHPSVPAAFTRDRLLSCRQSKRAAIAQQRAARFSFVLLCLSFALLFFFLVVLVPRLDHPAGCDIDGDCSPLSDDGIASAAADSAAQQRQSSQVHFPRGQTHAQQPHTAELRGLHFVC